MSVKTLQSYPGAIAEASRLVNGIEEDIAKNRRLMLVEETTIDIQIANAEELRNDTQRKAVKLQLLADNEDYQATLNENIELSAELQQAKITLERLRNEFSVAKLEARLKIANLLTGVELREAVGI